ncbi:MAG: hypothetical protein ACKOXO_10900 [Cyanobium sp.]
MSTYPPLQLRCTLTYGDIYGQILVWLLLSFLGLATGMALMAAEHPIVGITLIALLFTLSLPFLMFSFVTTLFNHLVLQEQRSP